MHRKLKIANAPLRSSGSLHSTSRSLGFTLTEVVVASALLIVAVIPLLNALTNSYLSTAAIEHGTRSLILAQAKLDEIKARSIYHYSSSYTENNTSLDGSYLCNVSDTGSGSDLRTVTVSVGFDLNGDSILASNEIEIMISTRLARRWNSG